MTETTPGKLQAPQVRKPTRQAAIGRWALVIFAAFVLVPYYLTPVFVFINPPVSAVMLQKAILGRGIHKSWRDLNEISPNLVRQVIVSEDARFCEHWGVDWEAVSDAIEDSEDGKPRGASTLSMQTAKNLFLWNRPAFIRKIFELPLAYYMDFVLGKKRLIEIYLNVAEWAPGVYGAEAASKHHFGKSAADLTRQEAAQLAAALPNPRRRNAGRPGPATFAIAQRLRLRAARERKAAACVLP